MPPILVQIGPINPYTRDVFTIVGILAGPALCSFVATRYRRGSTGPQIVLVPLIGLLVTHFARRMTSKAYRLPAPSPATAMGARAMDERARQP